jgi:Histidine phosphatase superfamily (branch 1)
LVPVPRWGLSDIGRARVEALAAVGTLAGTTAIISSGETKAIETAEFLARALGVAVEIREAMHENDRSSTGFLPPPLSKKWPTGFLLIRRSALKAGSARLMPKPGLSTRPSKCWRGTSAATSCSSGTGQWVHCCFATIRIYRLVVDMISLRAVETSSVSLKSIDAF